MTIDKPKAYTEDGNYIFISYSNRDSEQVYKAITILQDNRIHVWYDEDLDAEKITEDNERLEKWTEQVEDQIKDDNCKAVIFFVSENVLEYNKAILSEIEIVNKYSKSYCAVSLLKEMHGNEPLDIYIGEYFLEKLNWLKKENMDEDIRKKIKADTMRANTQFCSQFTNDRIYYHYEEEIKTDFEKVIKLIRGCGYREDEEAFPDGNVIHNGHIEYFPAITEATPFNFIYFILSRKRKGIGDSLNEILKSQTDRVHKWYEYPLEEFLKVDSYDLGMESDDRFIVYMKEKDISNVERLLKKRRECALEKPMLIYIYAEESRFEEIENRLRAVLRQISWEQECEIDQREMDNLILVQTNMYSTRQNSDPVSDISDIYDDIERWRILLSDRYYFKEVLVQCGYIGVKRLLHQRTPDSRGLDFIDADRRLAERWDRERFMNKRFSWEEKNV